MPLDPEKRKRNCPWQCLYASTRKQRAYSLQLASHRSDDLRAGQPSEKPLEPIEPISPLILESQQDAIGLDIQTSVSTEREHSVKLEQKAIHDLGDLKMKKRVGGNGGPQGQMSRDKHLRNDEFVHPGLPVRISEALQMVIKDQQKVSGMRVQLAEMRSDLDKRRTAQLFQWMDALKEIKSMLSSTVSEHTNTAAIALKLRALEAINLHSDDYLLRENEHRNFQRQLEAEENSLQQKQAHMAEMLQIFSQKSHDTESHVNFRDSSIYQETQDMWAMTEDDSDTARTTDSPREIPPLVEKYLFEIGEVRMYQERLGELSLEHAEITGREASFALVNMSLDENSQYFLDNYESQRLALEQIIAEKMVAAASIREQCEKEGLTLPSNLQEDVETELEMDIRESLPQERDLLWLSELDENDAFFEVAQPEDFNMYHFINRWIFHQLRHSTSQIYRYKSHPRLQDLNIDGDDLSELAIKLWFRDGRSKMASPLRTPIGSSSK
jgi:hypothetical protein